jgi:hypothetical protein
MSHHFDTPTAKEDPLINVCEFYLFRGNRLHRHGHDGKARRTPIRAEYIS